MGLNELYDSIVDEVVDNVREAFLEEGFDEQTLRTLKEAWLRRISESQQQRPQVIQPNPQHGLQQQSQSQQQQQQRSQNRQAPSQQPPQLIQQQQNNHQQQQQPQQIQQQQQQQQQQQPSVIQQNHNHLQSVPSHNIPQLDGSNATSDEDDDIDDTDEFASDDESDEEDKETDTPREDEDPLNSGDDVSNDESSEMFETENVVVCQYDKITRNRNKWKFHLKDGIMNINGRDYVFQKAVGDAEW